MMERNELERMERAGRGLSEDGGLTDLLGVTISGGTPLQRLESLATQMKDLYCFRAGGTPVRISFTEEGPTLEESVTRYFTGLKQGVQV